MGRHESFDPTNAIPFSLGTMGAALPAPGSPEALEAFGAACRAVDAASRLSDADMEALHIAPGASLWTSDKATDALSGNFSRFMPNEIEAARATPRARLEELQILSLRRELRMAEAAHSSRIRELHALVYGDEPDPDDGSEVSTSLPAHDAELIALVEPWEAARRLYEQRSEEQEEIERAATASASYPSERPEGLGADFKEWRNRAEEYRKQTGIDDAEAESNDALDDLVEIEDRVAAMPARTLAGLRLKARIAERNSSIDVDWPQGLGDGMVRDLLAITGGPSGLRIPPEA